MDWSHIECVHVSVGVRPSCGLFILIYDHCVSGSPVESKRLVIGEGIVYFVISVSHGQTARMGVVRLQ